VQAKYIAMFYGEEILEALRRHETEAEHRHHHQHEEHERSPLLLN
jgi:hypothetical protein